MEIIFIIITITIIITIAPNIIFLVINISAKIVLYFYKVSCWFIFDFLSFFVSLNQVYATTTWFWHTTSVLSYGII